jgi:hypothetical protein
MDEDGFEGARFFRKFIIRLEVYRFLQRVVFPFKPLIQDVKWQKLRRPKMELNEFMDIIKAVAKEQNFEIEGGEKQFSIEKGQWHSVAFLVKENSAGYLQVHQWESEKDNENGIWPHHRAYGSVHGGSAGQASDFQGNESSSLVPESVP